MRPTVATNGNQPVEEQRVLLVEDDDGIALPLAAALRGGGYDVNRVATGREALALAQEITRGKAARSNRAKKARKRRPAKGKASSGGADGKTGAKSGRKRRRKASSSKSAAPAKRKTKPVAGEGSIADTEADRRRPSTSPGNASPQADSSR